MASNFNELDYSSLNKNLQPKRKINNITTNIAQEIGKIFLNGASRKRTKQERLDALSSQVEKGSENMKIRLTLTIDYLSKEGLLRPESIKSLSAEGIKRIEGSNGDEKIQNIIKYLVDNGRKKGEELTNEQKEKLNQAVIDGLDEHYGKLAEKEDISEELKARNDELEQELNASEAANEVVESAVLKRWSRNNMIRVGKSIENINNSDLDTVTKARKVLWQANSFALFGTGKRFDWINKLPHKIDINEEYKEAVDNLKEKMKNASEAREKVAIRYIMRQINKAYKDYIDARNISEETRKQNMKDINMAMAA